MTTLHHVALPLILALAALGFAWSAIPAPRRSTDEADAVERGCTTILPEDRWNA